MTKLIEFPKTPKFPEQEKPKNHEYTFRCNCGNEVFQLFIDPETLQFTGLFCPDCHAFKDF